MALPKPLSASVSSSPANCSTLHRVTATLLCIELISSKPPIGAASGVTASVAGVGVWAFIARPLSQIGGLWPSPQSRDEALT